MKDTGTCPYCKKDFEVTQYGWGIRCPRCRRRVNIFPDPQVFIHTSVGICGVSLAKPETLSKVVEVNSWCRDLLKGVAALLSPHWRR